MGLRFTRRDVLFAATGSAAGLALSPVPWKLLGDSAIWTQPLTVIGGASEPFRTQQRPDQINQQPGGHQAAKGIIQDHGGTPQSRSQSVA